jgi:hypothetical protein
MAKSDDTKRYTAEALAAMRRNGESRSDWARVAGADGGTAPFGCVPLRVQTQPA